LTKKKKSKQLGIILKTSEVEQENERTFKIGNRSFCVNFRKWKVCRKGFQKIYGVSYSKILNVIKEVFKDDELICDIRDDEREIGDKFKDDKVSEFLEGFMKDWNGMINKIRKFSSKEIQIYDWKKLLKDHMNNRILQKIEIKNTFF